MISLYFKIFSAYFLIAFLSPGIATSVNIHVLCLLAHIIIIIIITLILHAVKDLTCSFAYTGPHDVPVHAHRTGRSWAVRTLRRSGWLHCSESYQQVLLLKLPKGSVADATTSSGASGISRFARQDGEKRSIKKNRKWKMVTY